MIKMRRAAAQLGVCYIVMASCVLGCGEKVKGVDPNLVKVTGKVTLDGKPLPKGDISFVSADNPGKGYTGTIDSSGGFSLAYSQSAQGALPGNYKVRIAAVDGGGGTMGAKGEVSEPKSLIPEKYNNPETSTLTATVEKGKSNHFTFDLKSQ
ncbi:MAG: hypothetical protein JSS49_11585 [Planctomycetes bacterium]|nr:hypothetical protein [Planctomycetota bacterium]